MIRPVTIFVPMVVVFETPPSCFWNKTNFWTKKHQCVFLFAPPRSKNFFVALQQEPDSSWKLVVSEFFVFLLKMRNKSAHHFCPSSETPRKGHKIGHFSKTRFLQKNSGLRATKALIVCEAHIYWWHTDLQFVNQSISCVWKMDSLQEKLFYIVLETHFYMLSKKGIKKEGFGTNWEKTENPKH